MLEADKYNNYVHSSFLPTVHSIIYHLFTGTDGNSEFCGHKT